MPRKNKNGGRKTISHNEMDLLLNNSLAIDEHSKRKSKWTYHDLQNIKPLTPNQENMFHQYFQGDHICAYGSAGTGKTFLALYLALNDVLRKEYSQKRLIIVRSAVATREIGYLPGTLEEKVALYEMPYRDIFTELFQHPGAYDSMKEAGQVGFMTTSFIRGLTWNDAVVVVDEIQNMNFSEVDSVITRMGNNSRLILCGDNKHQNDLKREATCVHDVLKIVNKMGSFSVVEFGHSDIVRSEFVKDWIVTREDLFS